MRPRGDSPPRCAPMPGAVLEPAVGPGATFARVSRFGAANYPAGANAGKGGGVTVAADPATTTRSLDFVVTWFSRHLHSNKEHRQ